MWQKSPVFNMTRVSLQKRPVTAPHSNGVAMTTAMAIERGADCSHWRPDGLKRSQKESETSWTLAGQESTVGGRWKEDEDRADVRT